MRLSVIYSNYNRSKLMRAGLTYLARQTMPKEQFEVVVVDDASEEDYGPVLEEFRGKLQMQWIRYDHTKHDIYVELNPDGKAKIPPEDVPLWYHTPAVSHNLGVRHSRGQVMCITQPELLLHPKALQLGFEAALAARRFVFGMPWQSERGFRKHFFEMVDRGEPMPPYDDLKARPDYRGAGGVSHPEFYYFLAFVHKTAIEAVGGVDEDYQRGVYAEDDDFRLRLSRAGWVQSVTEEIEGIHLNHEDVDGGRHSRTSRRWREGTKVNRDRWSGARGRTLCANGERVWGDPELVTSRKEYPL